MIHTTGITRYPESDYDLDETIDYKSIEYNNCLIEAIEAFERRDFAKSLEKYMQAAQYIQEEEVERRCLLGRYVLL